MNKNIITFVGMPGSGKSVASRYLKNKGIPVVRFGDLTDQGLDAGGLSHTEENERIFREAMRKEFGMAAYAIKAEPRIKQILKKHDSVILDGLYSWEEYVYLVNKVPELKIVLIYAERDVRYKRLTTRTVRPLTFDEAYGRDFAEIEKLNKGGPIAIADYLVTNNTTIDDFEESIDSIFKRIVDREKES